MFGALLSCSPKQSEKFLGTGESWLFTFFPSFKVRKIDGLVTNLCMAFIDSFSRWLSLFMTLSEWLPTLWTA